MKEIIVTISPEGKPTVEAEGFTGTACEEATRNILDALGGSQDVELKEEYHQAETETN